MNSRLATLLRGYLDGTNKSLCARIFHTFALVVAFPYSLTIRSRNTLFDLGILRSVSVPRFVVVVGNLTLGGVGKTPFVSWLTRRCIEQEITPGLISRGYKASKQETTIQHFLTTVKGNAALDSHTTGNLLNDEACELALRFPTTLHFLGPKRVEVANALLTNHPEVDILILDDAFQHRQIKRDLNILIIDALNPFGCQHVAPAGYLREPLSGMKRAHFVILNRADLISSEERQKIRSFIVQRAPFVGWGEVAQLPQDIFYYEKTTENEVQVRQLDYKAWQTDLTEKRFVAFCGLGAPQGFIKSLEKEKFSIADTILFPDHCDYNADDLKQLDAKLNETNADAFITTVKDFVKLSRYALRASKPIYALGIGVVFLTGQKDLEEIFRKRYRKYKRNELDKSRYQ